MKSTAFAAALMGAASALAVVPALAQTKVTNQGITDTEIVIGTIRTSAVRSAGASPVSNGMLLRVDEINAAGGINGRKLRLIIEDTPTTRRRRCSPAQKLVEKDKVLAIIGGDGFAPGHSPSQDILFRPPASSSSSRSPRPSSPTSSILAEPQERLKFSNLLPYVESTRAR